MCGTGVPHVLVCNIFCRFYMGEAPMPQISRHHPTVARASPTLCM